MTYADAQKAIRALVPGATLAYLAGEVCAYAPNGAKWSITFAEDAQVPWEALVDFVTLQIATSG